MAAKSNGNVMTETNLLQFPAGSTLNIIFKKLQKQSSKYIRSSTYKYWVWLCYKNFVYQPKTKKPFNYIYRTQQKYDTVFL